MLALLGSLLGLLGAFAPRLMQFFEMKSTHKQELELIAAHTEAQLKLMKEGASTRMAEIDAQWGMKADTAALMASLKPTGIKWVDALNGIVRPLLTVFFFGLYAAVKVATFIVLSQDYASFSATLVSLWGEEDWAVWAAIVTFWFGSRTFNKERGKG